MKKRYFSPVILLLIMSFQAAAVEDCASKQEAVERELHIAQQYSNTGKVAGLQEALNDIQRHCTYATVQQDTARDIRKLNEKIRDKERDIAELERDLRRSKADEDHRKTIKLEHKIYNKRMDLQELKQELASLNS